MNTDTYRTLHTSDQPILVLHGGSPAARKLAMRHLKSSELNCRIVELSVDVPLLSIEQDGSEVSSFVREFASRVTQLTKKEQLVLQCVLEGHTNKAISLRLDLSMRTIELRKASLMKKLDASSHTELIALITRFDTLQRYVVRQSSE